LHLLSAVTVTAPKRALCVSRWGGGWRGRQRTMR